MSTATVTVLSAGRPLDPTWELLAVDVRREVDRIPTASLVWADGDLAQGQFPVSGAAALAPGQELEIKLRYEGDAGGERTVFKGLVVRHGIAASRSGSQLALELKDRAVGLTRCRTSRVFKNQSDAEVMHVLLTAGGVLGTLEPTQPKHPELVQYQCTDWDFLLSRADLHGRRVVVEDGRVSVLKVDLTRAPARRFDYSQDEVFDFEFEADAESQIPDFEGVGWDPKEQRIEKIHQAEAFALRQGQNDGEGLAKALGVNKATVTHAVPLAREELEACLRGRMIRNRLGYIRGRLGVPGLATLKLLDVVELVGLGERFNGRAVVTGLRHRVDAGGWRTDLQFGLSPRRFCEEEGIQEVPAAGFLPAATGLQLAIVKRIADDPAQEFRVQVQLAGSEGTDQAVWARWTSPDAAQGRGWFFLPEVGDEVLVGFCNEDPRQPVILGALFSSKHAPPELFQHPDDQNQHKGIVTRQGTRITFLDADQPSVLVETPGGNKVWLDDKAKSVQLADQHGNTVVLDQTGIALKSRKDLRLEAEGNITLQGAKVDVR